MTITVLPVDTPGLGDRTYLAHDGHVALVVDPQRDYDRVLALADAAGVRITHVVESHIHNDYVTGGYELARRVGAQYLLNADDEVSFVRVGIRDGDLIAVGDRMRMRVLHTPGHTHTHLSYALHDGDEPVAVFTGGSLLYGSTGRPDLLGPDHTDTLAHAQWHSARRLAGELPDEAAVYPTHGFGSFCSATQSGGIASTIGQEKLSNPALTQDLERYVEELLAGLDAYPAYYAHMGPANAAGPSDVDLSPPAEADPAELRRRIDAGWAGGEPLRSYRTATFADLAAELAGNPETRILDVRRTQERAARHIPGSLHIPIHEVLGRLDEVPAGPVWVHCAGGYRAGVVAALLDAHGLDVVSVDDTFDTAADAGVPVTPNEQEISA